jgi:hypothetical protein
MKHYVLCLVDTDEVVEKITQRVIALGLANEEIFVLTSVRGDANGVPDQPKPVPGQRGSLTEEAGLLTGIGPTVVGGAGHFVSSFI